MKELQVLDRDRASKADWAPSAASRNSCRATVKDKVFVQQVQLAEPEVCSAKAEKEQWSRHHHETL